jgi:hypothetical protein
VKKHNANACDWRNFDIRHRDVGDVDVEEERGETCSPTFTDPIARGFADELPIPLFSPPRQFARATYNTTSQDVQRCITIRLATAMSD